MKVSSLIKHKIINLSEIPKDVIMNVPVVTALGSFEIIVENYGGLIEYTDCLIRIRSKSGQILISGNNLNVDYYTNNEMKIQGTITSINFIK